MAASAAPFHSSDKKPSSKIVNKLLTIFTEQFILGIWQGSECDCVIVS